jgi:hypothetical protein
MSSKQPFEKVKAFYPMHKFRSLLLEIGRFWSISAFDSGLKSIVGTFSTR